MKWWREELRSHVCWRAFERTPHLVTDEAVNMLAAIALAESAGNALFQIGSDGLPRPDLARSPWQFELAGVLAIARHEKARAVLGELETGLDWAVRITPERVWERSAWDPVLACRLARALLWTVPDPLPPATPDGEEEGWRQYLAAWRPGRPSRDRWQRVWRSLLAETTAPATGTGAAIVREE